MAELAPHVQRRMLKDYSLPQVEERVNLCLNQNPCFYKEKENWRLDLEGNKENDQFYSLLLKKGQALNLREILKNANSKKKKAKKILSEEACLISDGRFIQLDNGFWGLTEWEVETSHYSLKNLLIKAMKIHPGGLSIQQLHQLINSWRSTDLKTIEGVLKKLPYFEIAGDGVWSYNPTARVMYEDLLKKFLIIVGRQKSRWHYDRTRWRNMFETMQKNFQEAASGQREAAAALAEKMELAGQHEYLLTQMAEKDLLLSLRKREILRYREHLAKLEAKANSILYQCRLWVKRCKEYQAEAGRLKEILAKNQGNLEGLFTKIQNHKDRDRENKIKISELKELHSTKVAELQTEIVELKQKIERERVSSAVKERKLMDEISILSNDLKKSLQTEEEFKRSYLFAQQELAAAQEGYKRLERYMKNPLVALVLQICSFFSRYSKQPI
ncbi:phage-shock protein [Pelotomaculum propionicicum]|uniref:phage-shock protein n=1 Tax=Pelotomaculum propionicicum TaxID=258475 RepID=UPI0031F33B88